MYRKLNKELYYYYNYYFFLLPPRTPPTSSLTLRSTTSFSSTLFSLPSRHFFLTLPLPSLLTTTFYNFFIPPTPSHTTPPPPHTQIYNIFLTFLIRSISLPSSPSPPHLLFPSPYHFITFLSPAYPPPSIHHLLTLPPPFPSRLSPPKHPPSRLTPPPRAPFHFHFSIPIHFSFFYFLAAFPIPPLPFYPYTVSSLYRFPSPYPLSPTPPILVHSTYLSFTVLHIIVLYLTIIPSIHTSCLLYVRFCTLLYSLSRPHSYHTVQYCSGQEMPDS
jgi:hypothetical protein